MGVGTRQNRLAAGLFGGLAMAVQALLPLLLAAEIRLADAGEMPVCAPAGAEEALRSDLRVGGKRVRRAPVA